MVIDKIFLFMSLMVFGSLMTSAREEGGLILSGPKPQLHRYDLNSGNMSKIADIPKHDFYFPNYKNLAAIDKDSFLFESPKGWIGRFYLGTNKEEKLFEKAYCPVYFEGTEQILFSKIALKEGEYQEGLYSAPLSKGEKSKQVAVLSRGTASYCPIKLTSKTALVYLAYGNEIKTAIYDSATGKLENWELDKDCTPVFALSKEKLLCLKGETYQITDMAGKTLSIFESDLLNAHSMFPVLYLESENSILVQEYIERPRQDVVANLYLLDVSGKKLKKIASNYGIQKRGAVYISQRN